MTSVILRRSSFVASRRTLAALSAVESVLHHHQFSSSAASSLAGNGLVGGEIGLFSNFFGSSGGIARAFHAQSGPLNFRASLISQAGLAVADYSYEEGPKGGSDEGLEIAKLGIAQEIVSALAKKGITKLFPIQGAVLEPAMQGRDMIGRARTGTGKTLAFGIPIMDKIIQLNAKHGR
ncbi:hypothetical protein L6164_031263 [Bauhinia variegata]|uniref:Uncharacterized protein n=1 Tax=Bauhinia variegata TaxID=167791 RepID=A0ACB9LFB3_BAUVA|nr:hypothetical protein L6164_031263 [Bauhinia variegata]